MAGLNPVGYSTLQYWYGASATVQDTKMYFTIEKWCGMKCCKYEVDSLNRWEVIAIQT